MKVKELIEKLKECDPEADVLRQVGDSEDDIFQVLTLMEVLNLEI